MKFVQMPENVGMRRALARSSAILETPNRPMDFLHSLCGSLLAFAFCSFLTGCEKEDSPGKASNDPLPAELRVRGVPSSVKAEIYPAEGTRHPRPAVMVMSTGSRICTEARRVFAGDAHVLCTLPNAEVGSTAEADLQGGLRYLKKKYSSYTDSSPVFLVTDPSFASLGWKMMLREPKFFGHAFLAGLSQDAISATTLSALTSKGAKTLIVDRRLSKDMKLLKNVADRGGLKLHGIEQGPEALPKALALLKMSDRRTGPKHPSRLAE